MDLDRCKDILGEAHRELADPGGVQQGTAMRLMVAMEWLLEKYWNKAADLKLAQSALDRQGYGGDGG